MLKVCGRMKFRVTVEPNTVMMVQNGRVTFNIEFILNSETVLEMKIVIIQEYHSVKDGKLKGDVNKTIVNNMIFTRKMKH